MRRYVLFLKFFFGEFHNGVANHIIHFFGFTFLGYGLATWNWPLVLISPFIMEAGHIYNYARGIHREYAIKIIPLQWAVGFVFISIVYVIVKFFHL